MILWIMADFDVVFIDYLCSTLGKGSTLSNLKFSLSDNKQHNVFRTERGGEVTWHGPGQVLYYYEMIICMVLKNTIEWK